MKNNNFIPAHFSERTEFISGVLYEILKSEFGKTLVFKGGTMIEMFLNGGRFSEDLDFNVKSGFDISKVATGIYEHLKRKGYEMSDFHDDWTNVYNMEAYYEIDGEKYSCQIEIFKDLFGLKDDFYSGNFSGLNISIMGISDSFAHKCCAYIERGSDLIERSGRPKGRDLYDMNHFIEMGVSPRMEVIERRLGFNTEKELFTFIYKKITIEHVNKLDEFAFEIENFSLTKVDGLAIIGSLLKKMNELYLGGKMDYNYFYKKDIDALEKRGSGTFQITNNISCVLKNGEYRVVNVEEMEVLHTVMKKEKLKEFLRQYVEKTYY